VKSIHMLAVDKRHGTLSYSDGANMPVQGERAYIAAASDSPEDFHQPAAGADPAAAPAAQHGGALSIHFFGIPQKGNRAAARIHGCSATGCFFCSLKKRRGLPSRQ
jgi:hypothetical protein